MYTVAIVTSSLFDYGSDFIKQYANNPEYKIVCIYNHKTTRRSKAKILAKIWKIGITGAFTGYYLRKFYKSSYSDISKVCIEKEIPFYEIVNFKTGDQKALFSEIDLGISMGNGYIPSTFYSVFKEGMINIHHELLPEHPGAASVIWSLFNGKTYTGFTIHKVDKKIDCGDIVAKVEMPIIFENTLGQSITSTYQALKARSIAVLDETLLKYKNRTIVFTKNSPSKVYTTPTLNQFRIILRNFNKLKSHAK